jgi:cobalt-zinc-cadmium efflux system protein
MHTDAGHALERGRDQSFGHDSNHRHAPMSNPARLRIALALTAGVAFLELGGGWYAHSLALLADSAHVFMDAIALVIALVAGVQALRPANERRTFGYARFEILAALANASLLFAVTILIAIEALHRLAAPELPKGGVMLGVAAVGAAVNIAIGISLSRAAAHDLNVKAALFHVASDAVGAVAVMIGAVAVLTLRIAWIDPILSLVVAALIVVGVTRIVREASDVLLESAPEHAQIPAVAERIRACRGVVGVHDLHVWTIGSGAHALSAHVLLPDSRISEATAILREIDRALRDDFSIGHVTIQFECESCDPDAKVICTRGARTATTSGLK